MFLYSVYQPAGAGERAAERAVFIRQGFDGTAFLLTPVWALWHKLWRILGWWAFWTALVVLITLAFRLDALESALVYSVGALIFGLEADGAREAALSRKGMLLQGLSLGETARDAERIYFDRMRLDGTQDVSPLAGAAGVSVDGDFPGQSSEQEKQL